MKQLALVALAACSTPPAKDPTGPERAPACELGVESVVVKREGTARLERFDLQADPILFSALLPHDPAYLAYRHAIRDAGGESPHPTADPEDRSTDDKKAVWAREDQNLAAAYSGRAGAIHPVHCLEALLFARSNIELDQLTHPTEFGAIVLRKGNALRIYYTHGDMKYPPVTLYGVDEAKADHADGWQLAMHIHNHTVRTNAGKVALGVTAPSTNDVHFVRGLAADAGLGAAWVTNGAYTIEIPAAAFGAYVEPP